MLPRVGQEDLQLISKTLIRLENRERIAAQDKVFGMQSKIDKKGRSYQRGRARERSYPRQLNSHPFQRGDITRKPGVGTVSLLGNNEIGQ